MLRLALIGAVLAAGLAGCGDDGVTVGRVQRAVDGTFANLYDLQQREVGHPAGHPVQSTSCAKGGRTDASGPGDDWTCVVLVYPPSGVVVNAPYDVQVRPDGCFTATGPPGVVGHQTVQDTRGRTVTNPLFQFDGCFRLD